MVVNREPAHVQAGETLRSGASPVEGKLEGCPSRQARDEALEPESVDVELRLDDVASQLIATRAGELAARLYRATELVERDPFSELSDREPRRAGASVERHGIET